MSSIALYCFSSEIFCFQKKKEIKDFENPPMMMSYGFGNQSMGLIMHDCGLSLIKSYKKSEMF